MSQHDMDISNQTFPTTRTDLNNALKALASLSSGTSAPTTTYAYMLWYDTTNDILKMRNADDDAWISVLTLDQTNDKFELGAGLDTIDASSYTLTGFTGRLMGVPQVFTSSGTYTPTTGTKYAMIQMVGGGGGGAWTDSDLTGASDGGAGGGGAAGAYIEGVLDVSAGGYSSTITIGGAGAGGTSGTPTGTTGGDTIYADGTYTWTAKGGTGGTSTADETSVYGAAGGSGVAPTGSGYLFGFAGGGGSPGFIVPSDATVAGGGGGSFGGTGGASKFGGAGKGGTASTSGDAVAGTAATGYGAGGGGAATLGQVTGANGGAGAQGIIIITEFSA